MTGQIVDLDARIRNLKASETALVGYAEQAPKVTDLLEIQSRLTDTRSQIEQLTAQEAQLSDQAAMATLTVTYGTEVVAVTEAAAKWDPAAEVDQATATLIAMGQAVVSFLIVFGIVWLPLILTVLLIGGIALAVARRLGLNRCRRAAAGHARDDTAVLGGGLIEEDRAARRRPSGPGGTTRPARSCPGAAGMARSRG